jgi:hypothetical protein
MMMMSDGMNEYEKLAGSLQKIMMELGAQFPDPT